jgi:hypothetical protein
MDANGQGRTTEECRDNLAEAIKLILEDRREEALRGVPQDAIRRRLSCNEAWLFAETPPQGAFRDA